MRNNEFLKEVGSKIKAARQSKGISVRRLGELCNLDYANLSRMESGKQNVLVLTLKNIADALYPYDQLHLVGVKVLLLIIFLSDGAAVVQFD
jgi:transcriptional regulator with XRE-family HTH domain